jgi:hypothetical protein
MAFDRNLLPDPAAYFENNAGLKLTGRGKWRTTECKFHDGSDSMRVNLGTGAWVCMSCGVKGGDVLSHHMQANSIEFVEAAKELGAWIDDGKPIPIYKPTTLSPRAALQVLGFESTLVAVAAGNVAHGVALSAVDLARVLAAAHRINRIMEDFN